MIRFSHIDYKDSFLGNIGPKNKNYNFDQKIGIYTNSNIVNLAVMFNILDRKYTF